MTDKAQMELIAALEFYADPQRYDGPNQRKIGTDAYTPDHEPYLRDVTRDQGMIAREALASLKARASLTKDGDRS